MHDRPRKKRPRDLSQLARQIVEESTGEPLTQRPEPPGPHEEPEREGTRNPHAVALGKLGGSKGGLARRDKWPPSTTTTPSLGLAGPNRYCCGCPIRVITFWPPSSR